MPNKITGVAQFKILFPLRRQVLTLSHVFAFLSLLVGDINDYLFGDTTKPKGIGLNSYSYN